MEIVSLWEAKECAGRAVMYMNVHDDVPSFWVSQAVSMQTAQAKSPKCPTHPPFLFLSPLPILLIHTKAVAC